MDKAKIVEAGTHNELLKRKDGIYAKLWEHQSGGYLVAGSTDEVSEVENPLTQPIYA